MLIRRSTDLVHHILEHPHLLASVRGLPPSALKRVVDHLGLEDAGDLLAFVTTEQLEGVFDEDLWRSEQPGIDESFDAERFALWLAVLVEQGERYAANKVAEMDEDLVTLALCKHLLVIDVESLAQTMSVSERGDEEDALDKALESGLYHEFEQYRVIARHHESWEPIITILVELHQSDFATFERLLRRCCDITSSYVEDHGGLCEVLNAEQTIESDVAAAREERRDRAGFVPPSSALALLRLSRDTSFEILLADDTLDALSRAHFRSMEGPSTSPQPFFTASQVGEGLEASAQRATAAQELLETLERAEAKDPALFLPSRKPAPPRLPRGDASAPKDLRVVAALRALGAQDRQSYDERMLEAAFLANVLLAGVGTSARRLSPSGAAEAALALANLGAEQVARARSLPKVSGPQRLAHELRTRSLVHFFRLGVHCLCHGVTLRSARARRELRPLRGLLAAQGLVPN